MTSVARAFSILGLALTVALVHSWISPISIAADGNDASAQNRLNDLLEGPDEQGDPADPQGSDPVTDPEQTDPEQADPAEGSSGTPETATGSDDPAEQGEIVSDPQVHLTLAQTRTLFERHVQNMTGEVIIIDARGAEGVYEEGHIWGAEFITVDTILNNDQVLFMDVQMAVQDRLVMVEPGQMIIIYCNGGDCDESENVRVRLVNDLLLENVWIFEAGYPAWIDAGLPIATGSKPFGD